jgi:transposase
MVFDASSSALLRTIARQLPSADAMLYALAEQRQALAQHEEVIAAQRQHIALLEAQLRLLRAQRFGRRSEQRDETQLSLFESDEADTPIPAPPPKADAPRRRGRRRGFAPELPREAVYLYLSEAEKAGAQETFFVKVKEELDITPAKVRVLEYLQEKAVFVEDGQRRLVAAARPSHVLGKAAVSVSLLAYVIVAKYADALPLYRLEKILGRYGGSVSRTTLAHWLIRLSVQLQPLINLLAEQQLAGDYLQGDETRLQVLKEPGMKATSHKWIWVMRGGPPDRPVVLFEYDRSRGKAVAERLLEQFSGRYFQSDGYSGYDAICRRMGIVHLGCWDHVRRKFVEAQKGQPAKPVRASKADEALAKIGVLYRIEREIAELSDDEKRHQRQTRSVPVLRELKSWLEDTAPKLVKGGLTREAMDYALNQWPKLIRYCDHGQLRLSNILAENAIRPFVVGRKAWLFADTPAGARASAIYFSLIETAKVNGLEPYDYLCEVLRRLPKAETVDDLEALLPWNVKP